MRAFPGLFVLATLNASPLAAGQPPGSVRASDAVRVPILVYHTVAPPADGDTKIHREFDIDPETFAAQMQLLREEGYSVISLGMLADALVRRSVIPARAVVLTFDDGWETQFQHAFPVLARMGYTATFFVFTSPIGRDARFMTWSQLREMQAAGMTIGSHSRTHPYLNHNDALTREILRSREDIARELGTAPQFFAYPFGQYADRVVAAVRAAGFRGARAFDGKVWNASRDLWHLHAVQVTANMRSFRRLLGLSAGPRPGL